MRFPPVFLGGLLAALLVAPAPAAPRTPSEDLQPRLVTLKSRSTSLDEALREVAKQTGMEVADRRQVKAAGKLSVDLERVPFWQAVDAIARAADAAVSLYQADAPVSLVDGPYRALPVGYSGVFRSVVKQIAVMRDLATGAHTCTVRLEVAWEPRLQPFFLDRGPGSVSYTSGGREVTVPLADAGRIDVHGRTFLDLPLRFPAPARSVPRLAGLKGKFSLVTPGKMLTFTFDRLTAIRKPSQALKQEQEGVTVRLTRLSPDDDPWDVGIALDYPPAGPRFESYQSWLVNNEIVLEKKRGKGVRRQPLQGGVQVNRSTYPHAAILYYFDNKGGALGKPADWKLVYRTPGRIVSVPGRFEFSGLPLP